MNNKYLFFIFLIFLVGTGLALPNEAGNSIDFTYTTPINYSLVPTVNNSIYWDSHVWSDSRWLNIDGSNANQNIDISGYNLTSSWLKGKFNWTSGDTWNIFNGNTLTFNASKLATTYFNATVGSAVNGIIDGGIKEQTKHSDGNYDGVTFNFSEDAGAPGIDLRVNFTGITDFN